MNFTKTKILSKSSITLLLSPTSKELGQELETAQNEGMKGVDLEPKRVRRRPIWVEDYKM